jgi:hypothetical protein
MRKPDDNDARLAVIVAGVETPFSEHLDIGTEWC